MVKRILVLVAIAAVLHYKLEPEFYFVDFRHPEKIDVTQQKGDRLMQH